MALNDFNSAFPDVDLHTPGDRYPVHPTAALRATGWVGGQWVKYTASEYGLPFCVNKSDGIGAVGFLLFPSENYASTRTGGTQNYTSMQWRGNATSAASGASVVTMINGGTSAYFVHFETIALDGGGNRTNGAIVYNFNDELRISENGLLCNDSDANLQAATGAGASVMVGYCMDPPAATNGTRLGINLKF